MIKPARIISVFVLTLVLLVPFVLHPVRLESALGGWRTPARAEPEPSQEADRPYLVGWFTSLHDPEKLEEFARNGMSFAMPYHTEWVPEKLEPYLDEAEKQGVRVLVDAQNNRFHKDDISFQEVLDWVKSIVYDYKTHNAVWGWNTALEPELNQPAQSPENEGEIYNLVKAEDPAHPVVVVHWSKPYEEYTHTYDVLSNDWYPRDLKLGDRDVGEFNWMVRHSYDVWHGGIEHARNHGKDGYIAVPWGGDLGNAANPKPGVRDLTYREFKYHVFTAVVQGANGILFWMEPWADQHIKDLVYQVVDQIQSIGYEINNGITNDPQIAVNESQDNLVYRYGTHDNQHVLLAVNIDGHDVRENVDPNTVGSTLTNVRFKLPDGVYPSEVTVLDEDRTIPVSHGTFADDFDRFEVHIYTFTFPLPTPTPLPGDADGNGVVDGVDLELLQEDYLGTPTNNTDFNSDGRVDCEDFAILQVSFTPH